MEIKQLEPLCEEAFLSHIKCTDIFIWSNIQSLLAPVLVSSHTIFQEKKQKKKKKTKQQMLFISYTDFFLLPAASKSKANENQANEEDINLDILKTGRLWGLTHFCSFMSEAKLLL